MYWYLVYLLALINVIDTKVLLPEAFFFKVHVLVHRFLTQPAAIRKHERLLDKGKSSTAHKITLLHSHDNQYRDFLKLYHSTCSLNKISIAAIYISCFCIHVHFISPGH